MAIVRGEALYKQVAAEIREALQAGTYRPGQPLPSETRLMGTYRVSRPTVRQAVSVLRVEGLVDVIQGKGAFVRDVHATCGAPATADRTITRSGQHYQTHPGGWAPAEKPTIHRVRTNRTGALLLGLGEEDLVTACDRLLIHEPTGSRALHRMLFPEAVIEDTPLAPEAEPEQAYTLLASAGHQLTWHETVRTRLPQPDERAALNLPEATPILIAYRATCDADDHDRPLTLEETRMAGDRGELAYTILAQDPQLRRDPQRPRLRNSP